MHEMILQLKSVGVSYRKRTGIMRASYFNALKDVSLELYRGETLGIIGKNGVGKSTLLRIIAGIISPDKGEVVRYGDATASLLSLQTGFVPDLSGEENAILGGMLLGIDRKQIIAHLDEINAFAELGDFFYQPVKTYSSGMKARLGFSVAYVANPDITLLDETLGVGDAAFRKKSSAAMKEKIASDRTIVFVSHNSKMVTQLCDRVIWIDGGVTRMEGEVNSVLDKYSKSIGVDLSEE